MVHSSMIVPLRSESPRYEPRRGILQMTDNNEPFNIPPPNVTSLPVADLHAAAIPGKVEYEAYAVRKPEADLNDFKVSVRASILARCRARLDRVSKPRFPWYEIVLGLSTLTGGAFLGALPADIKANSFWGIFFYTVLPIVAVSSFVAYFFLRRTVQQEHAEAAADVLNDLPDPEKTR